MASEPWRAETHHATADAMAARTLDTAAGLVLPSHTARAACWSELGTPLRHRMRGGHTWTPCTD